jgi:hypothetical protein
MAINKNHEFEDLEGVKCAIVEKNVAEARALFLKQLLEFNGYHVLMVPSPPPKTANPETDTNLEPTFTIGVTDVMFNATNAIFGRLLKSNQGSIVTHAYWLQQESVSDDSVPYYEKNTGR